MTWHPPAPTEGSPRWALLEQQLSPAAARAAGSRGRKFAEAAHPLRSPFMRDRDRVLHSSAFRRLMHKTQVYVGPENDHLRTRLTHTLEVSQLSRTAARALGLNEDLTEAIALAHDLGHPPFGHAGERALDAALAGAGGFEHNRHTLRRVQSLEQRYPQHSGLNLSFEVLESLAQRSHEKEHPDLAEFRPFAGPLVECQVVDLCDSIAYDAHDVDDALHANLLTLADLAPLELWRRAEDAAQQAAGTKIEGKTLAQGAIRWIIDSLMTGMIAASEKNLDGVRSIDELRSARRPLLTLAEADAGPKKELERFLFERVYRHPQVVAATAEAEGVVRRLYERLHSEPSLLPEWYSRRLEVEPLPDVLRDYLAGMTDRYIVRVYQQWCG